MFININLKLKLRTNKRNESNKFAHNIMCSTCKQDDSTVVQNSLFILAKMVYLDGKK